MYYMRKGTHSEIIHSTKYFVDWKKLAGNENALKD